MGVRTLWCFGTGGRGQGSDKSTMIRSRRAAIDGSIGTPQRMHHALATRPMPLSVGIHYPIYWPIVPSHGGHHPKARRRRRGDHDEQKEL